MVEIEQLQQMVVQWNDTHCWWCHNEVSRWDHYLKLDEYHHFHTACEKCFNNGNPKQENNNTN